MCSATTATNLSSWRGAPNDSPEQAPLVWGVWLMPRRCFALDLGSDPELIAEYERLHEPGEVWPMVIEHIRASGITDMQIWRTGDRLFMIAETTDDYPRPIETPPEVRHWEELMWRFQRPLPHAAPGEKWISMKRIFDLEEQ